jgi:hypothetical protein
MRLYFSPVGESYMLYKEISPINRYYIYIYTMSKRSSSPQYKLSCLDKRARKENAFSPLPLLSKPSYIPSSTHPTSLHTWIQQFQHFRRLLVHRQAAEKEYCLKNGVEKFELGFRCIACKRSLSNCLHIPCTQRSL